MSTVQKVNFEYVSNSMHTQTRDFPLVDPTLADPSNAVVLVDGEWMTIDSNYKMERASVIGTPGDDATKHSWPLWAERGRTDVQAQAERKAPVIYLGGWECDSRIYLATGMTLGGLVSVATVTIGTRNYTGLINNGTIASPLTGITVGFITRLPANNGGKLRLRGGMLY